MNIDVEVEAKEEREKIVNEGKRCRPGWDSEEERGKFWAFFFKGVVGLFYLRELLGFSCFKLL